MQGVLYIVNQKKIIWHLCYLFPLGGMGPRFMFQSFEELCVALLKAFRLFHERKAVEEIYAAA